MAEVSRSMPVELTGELLRAVRQHPTTSTEDKDEEHRRIGWLICAWDVLMAAQAERSKGMGVVVPSEALQWLFGEVGEFEPADAHLPQPEGYKRPQFWWRSEFKRRAGL